MGGWRAGEREGGDVSSGVSACVLTSSRYSSDPGRVLTTEAATKTHVLGPVKEHSNVCTCSRFSSANKNSSAVAS